MEREPQRDAKSERGRETKRSGASERDAASEPDGARDERSGQGEKKPPAATGVLREIQDVVRGYKGRFRLQSERLHRFADDEHRWLGKTTFEVEFPVPQRGRETKGRS